MPGGGIALLNASQELTPNNDTEKILLNAIKAPYNTILDNAGILEVAEPTGGEGINLSLIHISEPTRPY